LAAISHPGVVKMLGEGEENSFCWYSMERIVGTDLRERLKVGPLSVDEVRELARVMLEALEVVHAAGFVHRDVKPSNILLAASGPKLCDFGIARLEGASTLTESAALLGSLRYMAPEQRWGKSDARSDLYALGVVMHEALALGVPGEKGLPPTTPAALARLIAKLTQTSAALRPQSATAARALLLPSSKRPALFAAAAVLTLVAGTSLMMLGPTPELATVATFAPIAEVAVSAPTPDAGALDPGSVFAEVIPDAGNTVTDDVVAIKPTRKPVGKPTKKPVSAAAPPPKGKSKITKPVVTP
jgi:eukaryotic-like serine/threonine-protein kinase